MSRLRVADPPPEERAPGRVARARAGWRALSRRYWRGQAAVAEHQRFERLRTRPVRRLLVIAFVFAAAMSVVVFWTAGLYEGWLHFASVGVVVVLDGLIIVAARGVTALPEHQLDERELRRHRRLVTRAYWAIMLVVLATTIVLPQLIEEGVVDPLGGGQVFALLWAVVLLGSMTGICIEAWSGPSAT